MTGLLLKLTVALCYTVLLVKECVGLRCLSCTDIETPLDCAQVRTCGQRERCSLEKYVNEHGFVRYKMGCKEDRHCGDVTSPAHTTSTCSECCDTDICAASSCGMTGFPSTYGPVCFNCDYPESHPAACDTIKQCDSNQVCGVNQVPSGLFEVKCRDQRLCEVVSHQGVCAKCCTDMLCNNNCSHGGTTTTMAPTTTPTPTTTPVLMTTAASSTSGCSDEDSCARLLTVLGHDGICLDNDLKHFCNKTCKLCPVCADEHTCGVLKNAFSDLGKDVCVDSSLATFCQASCGLCGGTGPTVTAAVTTPIQTTPTSTIPTPTTPPNPCIVNPCVYGSCSRATGSSSFKCTCHTGYTGSTCSELIDHCINNHCMHGKCHNKPTGYDCICNTGYNGTLCDRRIDHCTPMPCVNGNCTNNLIGYTCKCPPGYTGMRCDAVLNYCTPQPCHHGGNCINVGASGTFMCMCQQGYNGPTCDGVDYCANNPCVHGQCTNRYDDNTYVCRCSQGYEGRDCTTATNYCLTHSCGHGQCISHVGGFTCQCLEGFNGTTCNHEIDHCASQPCQHGSTCVNNHHNYTCSCSTGYEGVRCEHLVNHCASNPCRHGSCYNRINGYQCRCIEGFTGQTCATEINHCVNNKCVHGRCANNHHNYTCQCSTGYEGDMCDQVIDHCKSDPCVHGACKNLLTGFECTCNYGYEGPNCDTAINYCSPNPCAHGTCLRELGGFRCACANGYTGHRCTYAELDPCNDQSGCDSLKQVLQLQQKDVCQHPTLKDFCNTTCGFCPVPVDCQDLQAVTQVSPTGNDVYDLPIGGSTVKVNCDMHTEGGGWLTVLNRNHGTTSFSQSTNAYDTGFGDADGELWLGLGELNRLTTSGRLYQLRVDIMLQNGSKYYANYDQFEVGPAPSYNLSISKYYGNAGDALIQHNGRPFALPDHAGSDAQTMCAKVVQAGWWFNPLDCLDTCLTCSYTSYNGCPAVTWYTLGHCEEMSSVRMMIRPV